MWGGGDVGEYVHTCKGAFLNHSPLIGSLTEPGAHRLAKQAGQYTHPAVSICPALELQELAATPYFLPGYWGSRSYLMFVKQAFTHWPISPVPWNSKFYVLYLLRFLSVANRNRVKRKPWWHGVLRVCYSTALCSKCECNSHSIGGHWGFTKSCDTQPSHGEAVWPEAINLRAGSVWCWGQTLTKETPPGTVLKAEVLQSSDKSSEKPFKFWL